MSELINIYTKGWSTKANSLDRATFYHEEIERAKQWLKPERYIEVVHIYLFNEHGELIIQKRSKEKAHNPKLLDKSIGGHIQSGDSPNLTAMIETIQELKTPSIVFENQAEFMRTYSVLKHYISTSALLEYIGTEDIISSKLLWWKIVPIGNRVHTYFGIYAGMVKNIDRESRWILYYSLEDLIEEMEENPGIFTNDLHDALTVYRNRMKEFLSLVISTSSPSAQS
jgi:isopentenyldiphosphate isomerase